MQINFIIRRDLNLEPSSTGTVRRRRSGRTGEGEHIVVYYFRLSKGASYPRGCARAIVLSPAVVLTMKTDAAIRIKLTEWCLLRKGEASSGQYRKRVVFVADGILNDGKILWTA